MSDYKTYDRLISINMIDEAVQLFHNKQTENQVKCGCLPPQQILRVSSWRQQYYVPSLLQIFVAIYTEEFVYVGRVSV